MQSKDLTPILIAGVLLAACAVRMPTPGDDAGSEGSASVSGVTRTHDDFPGQRDVAGVPLPAMVAEKAAAIDKAFTGETVAVDSRTFDASADRVFSAVIDAMTALNIPVQRVNSVRGIISTEWVFQNADRTTITLQKGRRVSVRYRLLARVLRGPDDARTHLEVRTRGQTRVKRKWMEMRLKRRVSTELFDAVSEQLARTLPEKTGPGALIRP